MRHLFLTAAIVVVALPAHAQKGVVPVGDAERGTMVTVQGTIARILNAEILSPHEAQGAIRVYVDPALLPADLGEAITVHGFADDGLDPRRVYARSLTLADGALVTLDPRA